MSLTNLIRTLGEGSTGNSGTTGGTLSSASTSNLTAVITQINNVVNVALGILTAGVVVLAICIAYKFFTADTDDKRKNAKAQLIYAIIGIIVLVALMALTPVITSAISNQIK